MRYLLDSNIIILYLKNDASAVQLLVSLARQSDASFCVSTVAQMEVWEGIYAAPDPEAAEQQYHAFFEEITLLPFDSVVARRGAQLRHELRQQGKRTRDRAIDLQIAATALYHDLILVTYNQQDYSDIQGLVLYPTQGYRIRERGHGG